MGDIYIRNQPCLDPECGSSDARQVYEAGDSFCFSCNKWFPAQNGENFEEMQVKEERRQKKVRREEIEGLPSRGFEDRKISKKITDFFKVKCSYGEDGEIDAHYYPYQEGKAYKIRTLPKKFRWEGKYENSLFGKELFNGGNRRVIVTEGELDAMAVAQASLNKYGKIYPVVSIASSTMFKALLENRDWLRSFGEVILWFDNDAPGQKAMETAVHYIGLDKVKIAKGKHKDASDELLNEGFKGVSEVVWDATSYVPSGIIDKDELWRRLVEYNDKPSVPYPPFLAGINEKLKGHRTGEITTFISGTGAGKSTLLREDILHLLETTEDKIGVVSLEESPEETARKLAGMLLNRNPANEEISLDDLKVGFDKVFGEDRVILLDHQGSMKDESIVDKLEYMALSGCRYLFIDHITILVSEGTENLQGNEAQDKIMNDLLKIVKRHPVWIGLVSHLRKVQSGSKSFEEGKMPNIDDVKGSGSIKQISFDIVAFARDMTAEDVNVKNTIKISVLKSRFTGLTGPAGGAFYDYGKGRLVALEDEKEERFTVVPITGD